MTTQPDVLFDGFPVEDIFTVNRYQPDWQDRLDKLTFPARTGPLIYNYDAGSWWNGGYQSGPAAFSHMVAHIASQALPYGQWDRLHILTTDQTDGFARWNGLLETDRDSAHFTFVPTSGALAVVAQRLLNDEDGTAPEDCFDRLIDLHPPSDVIDGMARVKQLYRTDLDDVPSSAPQHLGLWAAVAPLAERVSEIDMYVEEVIEMCEDADRPLSADLVELIAVLATGWTGMSWELVQTALATLTTPA